MSHYGLSPDLAIHYLLVDTSKKRDDPEAVLRIECILPTTAWERNQEYEQVRSPLRWVRDPAGP